MVSEIAEIYLELNYNEIGCKATYGVSTAEALFKGKSGVFENKSLEEAITLCEFLKTAYLASKKDEISVSELGPYKLIRPLIETKNSKLENQLDHMEDIINILTQAKKEGVGYRISKEQHDFLRQFFDNIADIYLELARDKINAHLRS